MTRHAMTRIGTTVALAALAAGSACGNGRSAADTTLATDLSLAAQQRATAALDSAERAAASVRAQKAVPHRATSGGEVTARSTANEGVTVVKHTKRDAAIGAAAGAIIGATTSRDRVKGGIIGAAVGGIMGGVIGNNVDKTKKKKPD